MISTSANPLKDDSIKWIVSFVVLGHVMLAFLLFLFETKLPTPVLKRNFVAKTVKLSPRIETAPAPVLQNQASPPKEEKSPSKVEKKPVPIPKKNPAKPKVPVKQEKKPPLKKEQKVIKEPAKPTSSDWIARAKEKIGKIAPSSDSIAQSSPDTMQELKMPKPLGSLLSEFASVDSAETLSAKELAYRDELAQRLRLHLKLPEYGEVKLKLRVNRKGTIEAVEVIAFQSKINAVYLEKELPKLRMPEFGSNFSGLESFEFNIVMSNAT